MEPDAIVGLLLCKRSTSNDASAHHRSDELLLHYRFGHHTSTLGADTQLNPSFRFRVNQTLEARRCMLPLRQSVPTAHSC